MISSCGGQRRLEAPPPPVRAHLKPRRPPSSRTRRHPQRRHGPRTRRRRCSRTLVAWRYIHTYTLAQAVWRFVLSGATNALGGQPQTVGRASGADSGEAAGPEARAGCKQLRGWAKLPFESFARVDQPLTTQFQLHLQSSHLLDRASLPALARMSAASASPAGPPKLVNLYNVRTVATAKPCFICSKETKTCLGEQIRIPFVAVRQGRS